MATGPRRITASPAAPRRATSRSRRSRSSASETSGKTNSSATAAQSNRPRSSRLSTASAGTADPAEASTPRSSWARAGSSTASATSRSGPRSGSRASDWGDGGSVLRSAPMTEAAGRTWSGERPVRNTMRRTLGPSVAGYARRRGSAFDFTEPAAPAFYGCGNAAVPAVLGGARAGRVPLPGGLGRKARRRGPAECAAGAAPAAGGDCMSEIERALRGAEIPGEDVEAAVARFLRRAERDGPVDVAYEVVDSPLGPLLVAVTARGLVRLSYGDEGDVLEELAGQLSPRVLRLPGRTDEVRRELDQYFEGRRRGFEGPVDWALTPGVTRKGLRATARIPFGRLSTYRDVASRAGSERAYRAAGNALGSNPIPIVVPCHRVVHAGGGLGGYTGGLGRKQFLLTLEGSLDATRR